MSLTFNIHTNQSQFTAIMHSLIYNTEQHHVTCMRRSVITMEKGSKVDKISGLGVAGGRSGTYYSQMVP